MMWNHGVQLCALNYQTPGKLMLWFCFALQVYYILLFIYLVELINNPLVLDHQRSDQIIRTTRTIPKNYVFGNLEKGTDNLMLLLGRQHAVSIFGNTKKKIWKIFSNPLVLDVFWKS